MFRLCTVVCLAGDNVLKRIKKVDFRKGSGEILGFCAIIPALFALVLVLIAAIQLGITRQRMEYTAYSACRAAVVSSSKSVAETHASGIANDYLSSYGAIDPGSILVNLEVIDTNPEWKKGHFVKCTLSADVQTIMPAMFGSINGRKETTVIMMIENPST